MLKLSLGTLLSILPLYPDCILGPFFARMPDILIYILGALSYSIHVNASGKDNTECGSIATPCRSLSFTINNVSNHNDTIFLIASPVRQIRYTLESKIVIKHSLTIAKFPAYSQNPVITYRLNARSSWKQFYAFSIFQYVLASQSLTLNIKSVNFNANILTTFSEGFKTLQKNVVDENRSGFPLSLSIADSIINSPCHAINLIDISGYENVSINMKDLVIQNGLFEFESKRERWEPMKHIKNTIEINNVTICNTGNVSFSVNGHFNMSIEKLTFSNITWKNQELFIFTGGVLNARNVLIRNILADNDLKYNKSETKSLFLIYESAAKIKNILIKDSVGTLSIRPQRLSAVIIVLNSFVRILNVEMVGNSFQYFARAERSSFSVENMTLSENNIAGTLWSARESNVTLFEAKCYGNNIGCLACIKLNSEVLLANSSFTENEIYKIAYSISRSHIKLDNIKVLNNKIDTLIFAISGSRIFIDNFTFANNHVTRAIYNISVKCELEIYNAEFLQNNLTLALLMMTSNSNAIIWNNSLTENRFPGDKVYHLSNSSSAQLNNIAFIRNRLMGHLLLMESNSEAIIQNNTLTENNVSYTVYDLSNASTIQLNNIAFIRNRMMGNLLYLESYSKAIIQNNTLTENNVSYAVYGLLNASTIQLNNIAFIRNRLMGNLLYLESYSKAIIQNNTLTENNVSYAVYDLLNASTIQLNNIAFIRNRMMGNLLYLESYSKGIIQNNTLTENNVLHPVYGLSNASTIQLNNIAFIRNRVMGNLLYLKSYSKAIIQNNTLTENNVSYVVYGLLNASTIQLNNIAFIRNRLMKNLFYLKSYSKAIIQNNTLTENNVLYAVYGLLNASTIQLNNIAFIRNRLMGNLLVIRSNSEAIIQNNTLTENNVLHPVYGLSNASTIQLNNIAFIRNRVMGNLLYLKSYSKAIIQNNTLTENNVSYAIYGLSNASTIQLNNIAFIRNRLMGSLLYLVSYSKAIIQNNTLTENNVSYAVYGLLNASTIQLNNIAFIRNRLMGNLLYLKSYSKAIIQNNTLTENNVLYAVYGLLNASTIQLNNIAFIRNRLMKNLLYLESYSKGIIQNNTLTENNVSHPVYFANDASTIQLNNVVFIRSKLMNILLLLVSNSSANIINNTVLGNNINATLFFVDSSHLGIDRILIENNTFTQLIFAVISNVILNSMKAKKNYAEKDIISVRSTAGRINNTYIENCCKFLASAVTIRNTYSGDGYFPFKITNTEITWSYELPFPARPVIELTGNVSFLNVKLLVTSISVIEILRYSTIQKILPGLKGSRLIPSVFNITSLFINCTNANVKQMKHGTWHCIPCSSGKYAVSSGSLKISTSFQSKKPIVLENTSFTCLDCPIGADCTGFTKSRSNFYGYRTKKEKLKFLPCPSRFCCTGTQCYTIKSCNKNRVGFLCGRCSENYTESFLSAECISTHSCQKFSKFWLFYCIYALTIGTFLYYIKDLIDMMRTIGSKMSKIFKSCLKKEEGEAEIEMAIGIVGSEEHPEETSHFTLSGIFTLLVSFYQIKQLISVDVHYTKISYFSFITFLSNCLNLEIVPITYSSYCPMNNLDSVSKTFIKTYLLVPALLIASLINYFISRIYYSFCPGPQRRPRLTPSDRLGICLIRILMFTYKNMTSASLILLNCVKVEDARVLFIKGDMKCFQWWQIVIVVFLFTWVLFFPLSLKISFNMFIKDKISFAKFIWHLIVPCVVVRNYILNRNTVSFDLKDTRNVSKVKKVLSEIFEESYRLKTNDSREETVFYETWRLYQRVLLAVVATFWIKPIERITLLTPAVTLVIISYFVSKPYKPGMYILHWMEVFSFLGVFVCLINNMFRAVLYVYDINDEDTVTFVWKVFAVLDLLFSPICVLIYCFIIKPIYNKAKYGVKSCYLTLAKGYGRSVS